MKKLALLLSILCVGCAATFYDTPPAYELIWVEGHYNCNEYACVWVKGHYEQKYRSANQHSGYYYDPK